MSSYHLITALCTPLTETEQLHESGFEAHIQDQLDQGIPGLLVCGTMGVMQLLSNETYLQTVRRSVEFTARRAELLVGVGDTSYVRTLERIRMVEHLPIDGVVVINPYCFKYRQQDLVHYFQSLATASTKPLYLYDLPQMTGTKLELDTVRTLRQHPNIRGIKCSDHFVTTRPLLEEMAEGFRVIVAQPLLMDLLLRGGVREHLDGIFGIVPHWMKRMVLAAEAGNWAVVTEVQQDLAELLRYLQNFSVSVLATAGEVLNLRGISGNVAPAPFQGLNPEQKSQFAAHPIIRKALATSI